jgi:hypothetical protein
VVQDHRGDGLVDDQSVAFDDSLAPSLLGVAVAVLSEAHVNRIET